jgi:uncharacterized protein YndB with AHSA1/START domain
MNASHADGKTFVFIKTFNAPRDAVWGAWADIDKRLQWWKPMGTPITVKAYHLKPGGVMHYGMDPPSGDKWWGLFAYRDVEVPSRVVYVNSFSDENGRIVRAAMNPHWPLEILTTFTFAESGDKTIVKLEGVPLNATDEECAVFAGGIEQMQKAFGNTFGQLEAYLASH